ncbi:MULTISPECIES: CRISPR-associated protein Cas4 [Pyrobaculum]|uniref:CRISPR-associated exonuclease Cas4 n=1 Tax=Pyrobaculum arsenaticum TaxID=121277 RepID=A0A7L4P6F1_9CREN|nr:CRISPR-associated protein Cas4 [Pyrobaculum arsenaticum]MCY0890327.1 CRISPR-associated protein Cas4 [Pyrobaculum arsenaticum]NYR14715.1 CRISPR-associated protein Cas4 [Pyrobaculum arsenaticum]
MELLRPRPLCSVARCDDLELDVETALRELKKERDVFRLLPDVYAYRYDFKRLSPSVINDYEYCPRLLWVQHRLGLKLFTKDSAVAIVKGKLLHERYERAVAVYDNVIVEYKVEIDNLVGVVDVVIKRGGVYLPVEIKTGVASREAHKKQLQIYIHLLKAKYGYLVYRDKVEKVERDDSALQVLSEIKKVLTADKPPSVECRKCPFKPICRIS